MDKKYHLIGIGGIGMSALARILLDKKIPVSGSDLSTSRNIQQLAKRGAVVRKGHSAKHISPQDTVVFSTSIEENNPELMAARALKCPLLHRSELLAHLMQGKRTLACTGTHGKTTTTSLLTAVLVEAGLDPTFAVGGMIQGQNGRHGKGSLFVAEADESDGSFLNFMPEGAIVTNVEPEHMEYFKTIEALYESFKNFFEQIRNSELLFYCGDDLELTKLAKNRGTSYGFSGKCALQISNFQQRGWTSHFDLFFEGQKFDKVELALIGEYNALNAAAVFGLALRLGVDEEKIRRALATFPGVDRRCQKKKEMGGALLIDDYAHHPTEIKKTIKAVKSAIDQRPLIVVFQPHRYTRTRDNLEAYGKAFELADHVYVTDIYEASEKPIEGITAQRVIEEIQKHSTVPCEKWQGINLHPHDVFLTFGAGDIPRLHDEMAPPQKLRVGLVFGGRSCEHEISLRSARFVASSLNPHFYDIQYFGIDKEGRWLFGKEAQEILKTKQVVDSPNCTSISLAVKELEGCDLLMPILHGTYGEDGRLQGLFEMLGKPYMGPDYLFCGIAMNKVLTKRLVAQAGVCTPKDLSFGRSEWSQEREKILEQVKHFPVYVKPIHLGSSVGISCVTTSKQLEPAIETAFQYDTEVMIEEGKVGCREIEFAVVGNDRILVPPPGEKLADGTFVDYDRKYSSNAVKMSEDIDLDPTLLQQGQELAKKAYRAIGCSGMTRVDFLLDKEGKFWFFEMNPIPGMTSLSLFPKIWKKQGINPEQLFDQLIILALQRKRQQDRHFRCLASC